MVKGRESKDEETSTFKSSEESLIYKVINDEVKIDSTNFMDLLEAVVKEEDIEDIIPTLVDKLKPYLDNWTEIGFNRSDYSLLETAPLELQTQTASTDEVMFLDYIKNVHSNLLAMVTAYKLQQRLLDFFYKENAKKEEHINKLKERLKSKGIKFDEDEGKKKIRYEDFLKRREDG